MLNFYAYRYGLCSACSFAFDDAEFKEELHPREKSGENGGQFVEKREKAEEIDLLSPNREDDNPNTRPSYSSGNRPPILGVPYQGSKNRIARRIMDFLPDGKRFVDLFSGGGSMTHAAMLSGKYDNYRMNDLDGTGQQLFLDGMSGKWSNYDKTDMTKEEFSKIRGTPESLPWSFNGIGRSLAKPKGGRDRAAEQIRRVKNLETLKPMADKVESSQTDYSQVELKDGDVVYADIPYEGTDQRGYGKNRFDKQRFIEWAQEQNVPVFVSEYAMPEGWTEVATFPVQGMRGGQRAEKLFVQDKFAEKLGFGNSTGKEVA